MATIDDNSALLLYRVGPVLCASPCLPISAIIEPPPLTRPPGSSSGRPGIFKHANAIVSTLDLRYKFGVEEIHWKQPGRMIVTQLDRQHTGFHVDEILDVISMPASGWGSLPALLPRGIFTRTLLYKDHVHLYAEFAALQRIADSGYLRQYIQHLLEKTQVAVTTNPAENANVAITHTTSLAPRQKSAAESPASLEHMQHDTVSAKSHARQTATTTRAARAPASTTTQHAVKPRTPTHSVTAIPASRKKPDVPPRTEKTVSVPARPLTTPTASPASAAKPHRTTHAPPSRHSTNTSRSSRDDGNTSNYLATGFMLVLLFASAGYGLWYLLRDDNPHAAFTVATQTETTAAAPAEPVSDVPDTPAPPPVVEHEAAPPAIATVHTAVEAQAQTNTVTEPPHAEAKAPPPPAEDTSAAYRADIERDNQGVTITLDAPADDPIFTQAQQTEATTDKASTDTTATTTDTSSANNTVSVAARPTTPKTVEIIHIVVKGDTLWAIAKHYVKDPFRYPELARLSKIKNPDLIYPGNRVRIIKRQRQP
ncbi:MAG: LysM peptidoglycan-binding domain-containing protein [Gammaproteobacteria bacterium]|nr:LysM peptidoglycan-binding domain-containing protein [Gammaproteobacteria bacterium]